MKALISPNENNRIAQVEPNDAIFEVAEPLYWIDCPDNCEADTWTFDNGNFAPLPPVEVKPVETVTAA